MPEAWDSSKIKGDPRTATLGPQPAAPGGGYHWHPTQGWYWVGGGAPPGPPPTGPPSAPKAREGAYTQEALRPVEPAEEERALRLEESGFAGVAPALGGAMPTMEEATAQAAGFLDNLEAAFRGSGFAPDSSPREIAETTAIVDDLWETEFPEEIRQQGATEALGGQWLPGQTDYTIYSDGTVIPGQQPPEGTLEDGRQVSGGIYVSMQEAANDYRSPEDLRTELVQSVARPVRQAVKAEEQAQKVTNLAIEGEAERRRVQGIVDERIAEEAPAMAFNIAVYDRIPEEKREQWNEARDRIFADIGTGEDAVPALMGAAERLGLKEDLGLEDEIFPGARAEANRAGYDTDLLGQAQYLKNAGKLNMIDVIAAVSGGAALRAATGTALGIPAFVGGASAIEVAAQVMGQPIGGVDPVTGEPRGGGFTDIGMAPFQTIKAGLEAANVPNPRIVTLPLPEIAGSGEVRLHDLIATAGDAMFWAPQLGPAIARGAVKVPKTVPKTAAGARLYVQHLKNQAEAEHVLSVLPDAAMLRNNRAWRDETINVVQRLRDEGLAGEELYSAARRTLGSQVQGASEAGGRVPGIAAEEAMLLEQRAAGRFTDEQIDNTLATVAGYEAGPQIQRQAQDDLAQVRGGFGEGLQAARERVDKIPAELRTILAPDLPSREMFAAAQDAGYRSPGNFLSDLRHAALNEALASRGQGARGIRATLGRLRKVDPKALKASEEMVAASRVRKQFREGILNPAAFTGKSEVMRFLTPSLRIQLDANTTVDEVLGSLLREAPENIVARKKDRLAWMNTMRAVFGPILGQDPKVQAYARLLSRVQTMVSRDGEMDALILFGARTPARRALARFGLEGGPAGILRQLSDDLVTVDPARFRLTAEGENQVRNAGAAAVEDLLPGGTPSLALLVNYPQYFSIARAADNDLLREYQTFTALARQRYLLSGGEEIGRVINYMPLFWETDEAGIRIAGRRANAAFRETRKYDDLLDGYRAGDRLATINLETIWSRRILDDMTERGNNMAEAGLARSVARGEIDAETASLVRAKVSEFERMEDAAAVGALREISATFRNTLLSLDLSPGAGIQGIRRLFDNPARYLMDLGTTMKMVLLDDAYQEFLHSKADRLALASMHGANLFSSSLESAPELLTREAGSALKNGLHSYNRASNRYMQRTVGLFKYQSWEDAVELLSGAGRNDVLRPLLDPIGTAIRVPQGKLTRMSEFEAMEAAGRYVNKLYGGLKILGRKEWQDVAERSLLLTPDWLRANVEFLTSTVDPRAAAEGVLARRWFFKALALTGGLGAGMAAVFGTDFNIHDPRRSDWFVLQGPGNLRVNLLGAQATLIRSIARQITGWEGSDPVANLQFTRFFDTRLSLPVSVASSLINNKRRFDFSSGNNEIFKGEGLLSMDPLRGAGFIAESVLPITVGDIVAHYNQFLMYGDAPPDIRRILVESGFNVLGLSSYRMGENADQKRDRYAQDAGFRNYEHIAAESDFARGLVDKQVREDQAFERRGETIELGRDKLSEDELDRMEPREQLEYWRNRQTIMPENSDEQKLIGQRIGDLKAILRAQGDEFEIENATNVQHASDNLANARQTAIEMAEYSGMDDELAALGTFEGEISDDVLALFDEDFRAAREELRQTQRENDISYEDWHAQGAPLKGDYAPESRVALLDYLARDRGYESFDQLRTMANGEATQQAIYDSEEYSEWQANRTKWPIPSDNDGTQSERDRDTLNDPAAPQDAKDAAMIRLAEANEGEIRYALDRDMTMEEIVDAGYSQTDVRSAQVQDAIDEATVALAADPDYDLANPGIGDLATYTQLEDYEGPDLGQALDDMRTTRIFQGVATDKEMATQEFRLAVERETGEDWYDLNRFEQDELVDSDPNVRGLREAMFEEGEVLEKKDLAEEMYEGKTYEELTRQEQLVVDDAFEQQQDAQYNAQVIKKIEEANASKQRAWNQFAQDKNAGNLYEALGKIGDDLGSALDTIAGDPHYQDYLASREFKEQIKLEQGDPYALYQEMKDTTNLIWDTYGEEGTNDPDRLFSELARSEDQWRLRVGEEEWERWQNYEHQWDWGPEAIMDTHKDYVSDSGLFDIADNMWKDPNTGKFTNFANAAFNDHPEAIKLLAKLGRGDMATYNNRYDLEDAVLAAGVANTNKGTLEDWAESLGFSGSAGADIYYLLKDFEDGQKDTRDAMLAADAKLDVLYNFYYGQEFGANTKPANAEREPLRQQLVDVLIAASQTPLPDQEQARLSRTGGVTDAEKWVRQAEVIFAGGPQPVAFEGEGGGGGGGGRGGGRGFRRGGRGGFETYAEKRIRTNAYPTPLEIMATIGSVPETVTTGDEAVRMFMAGALGERADLSDSGTAALIGAARYGESPAQSVIDFFEGQKTIDYLDVNGYQILGIDRDESGRIDFVFEAPDGSRVYLTQRELVDAALRRTAGEVGLPFKTYSGEWPPPEEEEPEAVEPTAAQLVAVGAPTPPRY